MTRITLRQRSLPATVTFAVATALLVGATASAQASFPGGNGKIVFTDSVPSCAGLCQPEIYTVNLDGSGRSRLTFKNEGYTTPTWSPDGNQIAFSGGAGGQGKWNIWS
jgi:dipeptidyl aminopeptidase/acylaminoacyl peptidase